MSKHPILSKIDLALIKDYMELDPLSPSGLRWKKSNCSKVKPGDCVGGQATNGYYRCYLRGKYYPCHQLVLLLNGIFPSSNHVEVDHVDRNPANNQIENLRWVTRAQNSRNRSVGSTAYRYVSMHSYGRVQASYRHPKEWHDVYVGLFTDPYEAHCAALAHRLENYWI